MAMSDCEELVDKIGRGVAGHWLVGFEERTQVEVEQLLKERAQANKTHKIGPS